MYDITCVYLWMKDEIALLSECGTCVAFTEISPRKNRLGQLRKHWDWKCSLVGIRTVSIQLGISCN